MQLLPMTDEDMGFVMGIDTQVDASGFRSRVQSKSGFVLVENGRSVGLMHHCVLWDKLPFLNLVYVLEGERGRGLGTMAMASWEAEMKERGYNMVLLSTQADETAQHFYRKLGYVDCGALLFQNTPFDQPAELFFRKVL